MLEDPIRAALARQFLKRDRNRLNVAVSRARCLAYVVASPRLLEVNCRTVDQMRLVNALCRFVEVAQQPGTRVEGSLSN